MRCFLPFVLGLACSAETPSAVGLPGPGENCGPTRQCAQGLECRGGLCLSTDRDTGRRVDAGQPQVDAGVLPDATTTADAAVTQPVVVAIVQPDPGTSIEAGQSVSAVAELRGDNLDRLRLRWSSDLDGEIGIDRVAPSGRVLRTLSLQASGVHRLRAEVLDGDEVVASDARRIGVCGWQLLGDFQADIAGWQTYGDAFRDERGWLELTGNERARKGAIYKVDQGIEAGDLRLAFRISTGHCDEPGPCRFDQSVAADGFAMNIWSVDAPADLAPLFERAHTGGGLAYGVGGDYGDFTGDAFHIEFDTWYNRFNGSNEFHTDPTELNHVAVTLDGNPGNHVAFAAIPHIEDNAWHAGELVINGDHVRVALDGDDVIDQRVAGLDFKGGYVGFSGTTGYYTNYHRFDDLRTQPACEP